MISIDNSRLQKKTSAINPKIALGILTGGSIVATASGANAQATVVDVASVSAQATSATTAITGVGGVLLAMAFGLLVFTVATNVIRRVMGG